MSYIANNNSFELSEISHIAINSALEHSRILYIAISKKSLQDAISGCNPIWAGKLHSYIKKCITKRRILSTGSKHIFLKNRGPYFSYKTAKQKKRCITIFHARIETRMTRESRAGGEETMHGNATAMEDASSKQFNPKPNP